MRKFGTALATLGLAATALLIPATAAQAESGSTRQSAEASVMATKYYFNTWSNATSYRDASNFAPMGTLWAGRNYFYCQEAGQRVWDSANNYNYWWAKTDDDSGHSGVYVSATAFSVGGNDQPIPGLPKC
ncbi:hypothetical protein SLA_4677 [Streptomyces laurentii]|uniref:Uncharacterized protein n=1 Tax=Streptomyces laurentii TaxID=39478 RepID=A0A160P489_STRLU|nr:hypothetical protein SLA_4677 [Streptomyces laurentii]